MAFEAVDIARYVFYALDFIFGVMSWGVTADKLNLSGGCVLSNSFQGAACDAVIALGVISMLALLAIIVLRTLDVFEVFTFPEFIEIISFIVLASIWFILAIVSAAVSDSFSRRFSDVKLAIASAWIAFLTHTASCVISVFARKQGGKE